MLPVFLHFQYDKRLVCDNCNKHGEGMLVLMKYAFCKECAKKLIPIYQADLNALLEKFEENEKANSTLKVNIDS